MNILIIQLGRFGDIYQSWPVVHAVQRKWPEAKVHILVRERFADALVGLEHIASHRLPTKNILEPFFRERAGDDAAIERLNAWLLGMRTVQWDYIVNLSFSPASSCIVDLLTTTNTQVAGYTRTSDGFLQMPDDASAYFYAQVGIERSNRIHICDLFALVAGVELDAADFVCKTTGRPTLLKDEGEYIVVHLGASQTQKRCTPTQWKNIISALSKNIRERIVLIGTDEERIEGVDGICLDLCGKTAITDLPAIVANAKLLVGCDSVAIQIASLTNTATLNISFGSVNFWETGPRAAKSKILWFSEPQKLQEDRIASVVTAILGGENVAKPYIQREEGFGVLYSLHGYEDDDWSWELTRSLYMNHSPHLQFHAAEKQGLYNLIEVASLGVEQTRMICNDKTRSMAIGVLNEVDTLVQQIVNQSPRLAPIVRWFQTEKSRIQPGSVQEIVSATEKVFEQLKGACEKLLLSEVFHERPIQEATWKS